MAFHEADHSSSFFLHGTEELANEVARSSAKHHRHFQTARLDIDRYECQADLILGDVLGYVACPICGGSFAPDDATELYCSNGHAYPVVAGVPRLIASNEGQVISDSFSHQWSQFDYEADRTWGKTAEERLDDFLRQVAMDGSALEGKLVLDAGCGNAILSDAVSTLGATVVATDISDSVFAAARRFAQNRSLHFVQSDISRSAFKPQMFDVIFCGGVLHHTKSTHWSLIELLKTLRPGGTVFVWLYWKVPGFRYRVKAGVRRAIAPLPVKAKHLLVLPFAGQNWIRHRSQGTWRETLVIQLDYFTPRYRWEHTPDELSVWYRELGLTDIQVTEHVKDGFGVMARSPA